MKRWMSWLLLLGVVGTVILFSGGSEFFVVWGDEGECGFDENSTKPNLLTIYHTWDTTTPLPYEQEPVGPGAVTIVSTDREDTMSSYVRLEVCNPTPEQGPVTLTLKDTEEQEIELYELVKGWGRLNFQYAIDFPSSTVLWVKVNEPSQQLGDIEICATTGTEKTCEDSVKITAMQIDMTIHHGNASRTEVHEEEEDTRGAFTVVNRNDTDADGIVDNVDDHIIPLPMGNGQLEADIMKLVIKLKPSSLLDELPIEGLEDTVKLNVSPGAAITFWENSTKGTQVQLQPEFPLTELNKTVWVEATEPSTQLGDIKIELDYMEKIKETVIATSIWPEIDVREVLRRENRVGRSDPKMTDDDKLARNKLLVWHDVYNLSAINAISFEAVKTDKNHSPIWIQIEEKEDINPEIPLCELLEVDSKAYSRLWIQSNDWSLGLTPEQLLQDNWNADLIVKYGIDYDGSETLSGEEIKGEYEIFGITETDYNIGLWTDL